MCVAKDGLDVSALPEEVAVVLFNRLHQSVTADIDEIQEAFQRSAEALSGRFGSYLDAEGEPSFDYALLGRDMLDLACVISDKVAGHEGKVVELTGNDLFEALAYLSMCISLGHSRVRGAKAFADSIDESLSIYNSLPEDMRENPLVYMQRMSEFRDEISHTEA